MFKDVASISNWLNVITCLNLILIGLASWGSSTFELLSRENPTMLERFDQGLCWKDGKRRLSPLKNSNAVATPCPRPFVELKASLGIQIEPLKC